MDRSSLHLIDNKKDGKKVEIITSGNREDDILINTQNFTRIIEEQIRKYPEQWFWVHQRWKTKLCQVKQKKGK